MNSQLFDKMRVAERGVALEVEQMTLKNFDTKELDNILEKMLLTVNSSKDEVFQIGEQCRQDYETLLTELKEIRALVLRTIQEGDVLETKAKFARQRLSELSKHFSKYSEDQVRDAYEKAHILNMKLVVNRQTEQQLRVRRDELERRLQTLQDTIDRAEHLVSQISVVSKYLTSDLKEIGEAIESAKAKQDFGLKIIEAQEEERKRISREIHDGPAQLIANVLLRSDLTEKVYREKGMEQGKAELRSLKEMVRAALSEVRRIIYDLRPMALDDLGLIPTLRKYLDTTESYNKTAKITFSNIGEEKRLPSKYEVALFRLVQESVQNALKHAEASEIQVKIEIQKSRVVLIVKDNGKGFDVAKKKKDSFGIIGMKERVELLTGELKIHSKIGCGTLVIIQVPIEKEEN